MTTRLDKAAAIEKIQFQLDMFEKLLDSRQWHELIGWKRDTEVTIRYVFGESSEHLESFQKIHYFYRGESGLGPVTDEGFELLRNGVHRARSLLKSLLREIQEFWPDVQEPNKDHLPDLLLHIQALHPRVVEVAEKLFRDGHYRQATLDTYIAVVEAVKTKSRRHDLDGSPLMTTVFSQKNPILKVSEDPDEQLGYMWMFSGAVMGVRNAKAHKLVPEHDPQATLEWLSFASALFRILDKASLATD